MEENKNGFLFTLQQNREKEEEQLSLMSEQERKEYMEQKTKNGLEIAKKLGLKVGK